MTLIRVEHKKNYTVVNNFISKDSRLSWKAKGIWLYAFSRPDDWTFLICDIVKHSKDGIDSVRAGLLELEECGYLIRERKHDEKGHLLPSDWTIYETPRSMPTEPKSENPKQENPTEGNPLQENPTLLSTDSLPSTEATQPSIENNNKQQVVVDVGCLKNSLTKDDLHFYVAKFGFDWRDCEINDAFKTCQQSKSEITDPFAYIDGIITKKRTLIEAKKEKPWMTKYSQENQKSELEKCKSSESDTKKPHSVNLLQAMKTPKNCLVS